MEFIIETFFTPTNYINFHNLKKEKGLSQKHLFKCICHSDVGRIYYLLESLDSSLHYIAFRMTLLRLTPLVL